MIPFGDPLDPAWEDHVPLFVVGFTGTQRGWTEQQQARVVDILVTHKVTAIHLGDCIGADAQAHAEADRLNIRTIGHPPNNPTKRAFLIYGQEWEPKPYLVRNRDIVTQGTHGLIACPKDLIEPRSLRGQGTWTTVKYAREARRHLWIVLPDGTVNEEWTQ